MTFADDAEWVASTEAIFGSASRGDADARSDRDILIADDDVAVLKARTRALEAEGWSVAAYTFAKLHYLVQHGALFIQHLKLESTVLRDQDGRFGRLLTSFQPLKSYRGQLRANDRLAQLAGTASSGPRGMLLAADILYVALRNFGVLSLAERGIHTYAFSSILEALEAERVISPGGRRVLMELRFLKCLYRAGERERGNRIQRAVLQALSALPSPHFPKRLVVLHPRTVVLSPAPLESEGAYFQLRDLEKRFVALETLRPNAPANAGIEKLSRWISEPRRYASLSRKVAPQLRRALAVQVGGLRVHGRPKFVQSLVG